MHPQGNQQNEKIEGVFSDTIVSTELSCFAQHLTQQSFAYVDFATPEAKQVAITMSESPLDGRRLLIKNGAWYLQTIFFLLSHTVL